MPLNAATSSRRAHRHTPDLLPPGMDELARARLALQGRAHRNLHRRTTRSIARVAVLLAGDLAALLVMRVLVRAIRDHAVLGAPLARALGTVLPRGVLGVWQFAVPLVLGLLVTGNYGQGDRRRDAGRILTGCALAMALPIWGELWTRGLGVALTQYALTCLVLWLAVLWERLAVDRVVVRFRPRWRDAVDTLLVGEPLLCREMAQGPMFAPLADHFALGMVNLSSTPARDALGSLAELPQLIHELKAEAVLLCGYVAEPTLQQVLDAALMAGCRVMSLPRSRAMEGLRPALVWCDGVPVVTLSVPGLRSEQLLLKRVADVIGASLGLVVLAPLLAALGLLVKLDSRGPALFGQVRMGLSGRPFRIFKFRTMVRDAEGQREQLAKDSVYADRRLFKIRDDPRVTGLGRWLRRWSLDELPQLWNVLVGDMSLVGPRPPLPTEVASYEERHTCRFQVRPGMTGPWQVSGRNAITDFEEVIRLEERYIDGWSVWRDLGILGRTIPAVVGRRGAY
jgi:exopolysaccharide biosynthesis polyprenyl glycosylphosphotransferase